MQRPLKVVSLFVVFLLLLSACSWNELEETEPGPQTSLWLVDWSYEKSVDDAFAAIDHIDNIFLFATYFDEIGELYQPETTNKLIAEIVENPIFAEKDVYLTIVNDQFKDDGTIIQKNPELLKKFFASPSAREAHVRQIVDFAKNYSIDGIEIDYEQIPLELVNDFLLFATELKRALEELDLVLRVVLEPRFPVETHPLPEELQYVIMAYNLHGYHNGAGPKADYAFLDQLAEKFPNELGNIEIAFSIGGFSWRENDISSLTNEQIADVLKEYDLEPVRDRESGALSFRYQENGSEIEVWYADKTTVHLWQQRLSQTGDYTHFSIWRAGWMTEDMLPLL